MNKYDLIKAMVRYERGCPQRVQHFLKVHAFAELIGRSEGLDQRTMEILEAASIVHDIGIRPSLAKYDSCAGKYQEKEGPAEAERMLNDLEADKELIERVKYLVGHHHTYSNVDGADYRILIEADFLVNMFEGNMKREAIESARRKCFQTETGKMLLDEMFLR